MNISAHTCNRKCSINIMLNHVKLLNKHCLSFDFKVSNELVLVVEQCPQQRWVDNSENYVKLQKCVKRFN